MSSSSSGLLEACPTDFGGCVNVAPRLTTVQDFLDVNALCAGSIAAITTGASAIAAYSGALHAACRYNGLLKQPTPGGAKCFRGHGRMRPGTCQSQWGRTRTPG